MLLSALALAAEIVVALVERLQLGILEDAGGFVRGRVVDTVLDQQRKDRLGMLGLAQRDVADGAAD